MIVRYDDIIKNVRAENDPFDIYNIGLIESSCKVNSNLKIFVELFYNNDSITKEDDTETYYMWEMLRTISDSPMRHSENLKCVFEKEPHMLGTIVTFIGTFFNLYEGKKKVNRLKFSRRNDFDGRYSCVEDSLNNPEDWIYSLKKYAEQKMKEE